MLWLPEGATLKSFDPEGEFDRALKGAGLPVPLAARLQRWWPGALLALVAIIGLLATGYFKGLPAAARWVTFALPPRIEDRMGGQVLTVLDRHYLKPSRLSAQRRSDVERRFADATARGAPGVRYRLEFR